MFTHVRSAGAKEPGSSIEAVEEVIGAAAVTGASLQIVHINSSCLADAPECLAMVAGARARGLDVTTEAYPYVAGMTELNSALFNRGWQEKFGISYDSLMLPGSGERLTQARSMSSMPRRSRSRSCYSSIARRSSTPSLRTRWCRLRATVSWATRAMPERIV